MHTSPRGEAHEGLRQVCERLVRRPTVRQLDELDKKLAEAAQKLMQEMGESAKSLEQGAESLNRMAQKDMTQEQKKELLRRLEELREVLRQQGKGGKSGHDDNPGY